MASKQQVKFIISAKDKTKGVLAGVRKNFKKTNAAMMSAGSAMSMGLTAPIALFGTAALKSAGDYEAAMKRVEGLTGATGESLDALKGQAKELGRTTMFSASEAAQGMGFLAQAGFKSEQVISAMPGVLDLAAAGQLELGEAATITGRVLRGFGKDTSEAGAVADVLAKASTMANQSVGDLGEAFGYAGATASSLGVSFEETAAVLSIFADAGKEGSKGGAALTSALADMANEGGEAYGKLKDLGISAQTADGKLKPLVEIVKEMEGAGIDAGDAIDVLGKRAGPAFVSLLGRGSEELARMTGEIENSGGAAKKLAGKQMEGLNGSLKRLKSAFEGLQIAIAESGLLTWVTNFVERVVGWTSAAAGASKETLGFAMKIAGILAVAGPVLFVLGKMGAAIAFLTSPIGWVIMAVGLLAVAWARWGTEIKQILEPVIVWIQDHFDDLAIFIFKIVGKILGSLSTLFDKMGKLPGKMGEDFRNMSESLKGWQDGLETSREKMVEQDDGAKVLSDTLNGVQNIFGGLMEKLNGLGGSMAKSDAVVEDYTVDVDKLAGTLEDAGNTGEDTGAKLQRMADAGKVSMGMMKDAASEAAQGMADAIGAAVFESKNLLESLGSLAKSVFSTLLSGFIKLGISVAVPSLAPFMGVIPGRAGGGSVFAGKSYVVGEQGREVFTPTQNGKISSNSSLRGGGDVTNNFTIKIEGAGNIFTDPLAARRVAEVLKSEISKVERSFHDPEVSFG